MRYQIRNDSVIFESDTFGAEPKSFKLSGDDTEYIWQADPKSWNRNGPMCFPVLGNFPNDTYTFGGNEYHMTIHGFAMESEFTVAKKTPDSITYELLSNEETLKQYPFEFRLLVEYKVVGNAVNVKYDVFNTGDKDMLYAVGGHPGFSCPIEKGESFEDYYIEFDKTESIDSVELYHSPISVIENLFGKTNTVLPLSYDLFDKGAIVYKGLKSDNVAIKSKKSSRYVNMNIAGFPYFALWTCRDLKFICLEPWHGVITLNKPDQHILENREAMMTLRPNGHFDCTHIISIGK